MRTLPDAPSSVNSKAAHALPQPPGTTDREWIAAEAARWRSEADPVVYDVAGFVASVLESLYRSMRFSRIERARDYAAFLCDDLGAIEPYPFRRVAALATDLDAEAGRYLSVGTDAARLAAREIQRHADTADRMGSATVEDWVIDEAAWQAAAFDLGFVA